MKLFKDIEMSRLFALLITVGFAIMIGRICQLTIGGGYGGMIVGIIVSLVFVVVVAAGMAAVDG